MFINQKNIYICHLHEFFHIISPHIFIQKIIQFFSDILLDDPENDPGAASRPSRSRRPRPPGAASITSTSREREFTGNGLSNGLSSAVTGAAASAASASEETQALLHKLRNL